MAILKIAKVILPIALDREFDYSIGPDSRIKRGARVLVDFRGRKIQGIVTSLESESKIKNLKPIIAALDAQPFLSAEHLQFAKHLSKFYPYNIGEFLFMMLPSYLKRPKKLDLCFESTHHQKPPKKKRFYGNTCRKKFIKAASFAERYGVWRQELKASLENGSAIICFPQVSYLLEAKKIIAQDFGQKIKVIHSYENEKELFKNWQDSRANSLILGTRLAIFYYPLDLNLIIVEEENSPFYFQEEKPFYHLLEVALLLSRLKKANLILSANYPALQTYRLIKDKTIELQEVPEEKKDIRVVNIEKHTARQIVNPILGELLRKNIEENRKSVIFLNRKGFGSASVCSACGHILTCERCLVPLRILLDEQIAFCPYCSAKRQLLKVCPKCNNNYVRVKGWGIERLQSALKKTFPEVNIADWPNHQEHTQIILSTSKIFTSLYSPQVFDTGFVLGVDYQMARPDYETVFDTFLYLKKISLFLKNIFVFTCNEKHYLFDSLQKDWKSFYDAEFAHRNELGLPPFTTIAKITLRSSEENKLFNKADILYNKLKSKVDEVYGPFKEYPFKLRGKFHYSVIAKSKKGYLLRSIIKEEVRNLRLSHTQIAAVIK